MPRIHPDSKHSCVGDKIHDAGALWWCYCREPECRRRQAGIWPAELSAVDRFRRYGKGRPNKAVNPPPS
ncbi:hypothetical protein AB0A95_21575 [Micromonospora sp. NPDC049230]|uniref:hypothetical protein n=1 Tax=Micromonospora sp. NPDC049230 TaxID=3155502 RepID=UPI00340F4251